MTPTPTPCVDLRATPGVARVRLESFRFVPACLSMRTSQGLSLHNAGDVVHNFSIPNTLIDLDTQPRQDTDSEAIGGVVRPGVYEFFCKYHRSRGMSGAVRVLP